MCLYWKKVYLCDCISHVFRDRCPPCLRSEANDKCNTEEVEEAPRKSYFKCFECLIKEDKAEKEAKREEAQKVADELVDKEEKARLEQLRREEKEKADREEQEEIRRKRDLKAQQERAKRESGVWQETVYARRGKGRRGAAGMGSLPQTPFTAKPVAGFKTGAGTYGVLNSQDPSKDMAMVTSTEVKGDENKDVKDENKTEKKGKSVDLGGRAGRWGPSSSPKTILKPEKPNWKKP
jgi:hypothetical protein